MKTKEEFQKLQDQLPKGFKMDFSVTEYINDKDKYYPSATKSWWKKGDYLFLRIFFDKENQTYDLNSHKRKIVRQTKDFKEITQAINNFK